MEIRAAKLLRQAVAAGSWNAAQGLMADWRSEVETAWRQSGPTERAALQEQTEELLGWIRKTTLAAQAHAHKSLIQLAPRRSYVEHSPAPGIIGLDA